VINFDFYQQMLFQKCCYALLPSVRDYSAYKTKTLILRRNKILPVVVCDLNQSDPYSGRLRPKAGHRDAQTPQ